MVHIQAVESFCMNLFMKVSIGKYADPFYIITLFITLSAD